MKHQFLVQYFDDGPLGGCNEEGLGIVLDTFCTFNFSLALFKETFNEVVLES